jgi:UDP-N-acetylmuramoyl-tripeptide--D-alanyl-D-alanine ligase
MLDYPLELIARVLEARCPRGALADRTVRRVCTDSRQVQPGDLFFALKGEKFDAHQFVASAVERGAVGAVVEPDRRMAPVRGTPLLEVPNPLLALGTLGGWHRNRFNPRMVAVTGSVGKTTVKDLIHAVLSQQWTTLKSPGNLNAEIGLPLTLLELGPQHEAAVVEMAMRGPGQIRYLARLARPEVGVITNIGYSHLELLGSQDAIADAKAELLDFLPHGGAAVLNAGDAYFSFLQRQVPPGCRLVPFGMEGETQDGVVGTYLGPGHASQARPMPSAPLGARFLLHMGRGQRLNPCWVPLLGRHNARNAVAAAAVGTALGISLLRISKGLSEADVSRMRMTVHRMLDGSMLLDDAYNASSPEAMIAALEVLNETPGLRKVAVLGNMLELGTESERAHARVGAAVAEMQPNILVTVGAHARAIADSAVASGFSEDRVARCDSNDEALEHLLRGHRPGEVLLVKGSRGMAMEGLVQALVGSEGG